MINDLQDEENSPSVISLLSEILKKYGLDEDTEKTIEKIEKDKPINLEIISNISYDFVNSKISDKELPISLQEKLNIPAETAKKISDEVKTSVIPMIREIITKRALKNSTTKIENNKEFPIVGEKLKTTSVDANPVEKEKIIETPKIPKKTEKVLPTKNENTQKKGPDSYREPIE